MKVLMLMFILSFGVYAQEQQQSAPTTAPAAAPVPVGAPTLPINPGSGPNQ